MAISGNKQCACTEAYRVQRETTLANNTQSVNSEIKLWKYHALRHNGGPEKRNGAFLVDPISIPEGTELRALICFCFVKSICALSSGMNENHPNRDITQPLLIASDFKPLIRTHFQIVVTTSATTTCKKKSIHINMYICDAIWFSQFWNKTSKQQVFVWFLTANSRSH